MAETLSARLEQATTGRRGTITFITGESATPVTWAQLHDDARVLAGVMQRRGIAPGAHVAILGPTTRPLVTTIQATWLCGAAAVVLPLPMRLGSIEEFVEQTRTRIRNADATLLVIDPDLAAFYEAAPGDPPIVLLDELVAGGASADAFDAPTIDPASLAVLQFTSGSTADPKGVMLTHRQILANLDGAITAAHIDPDTDVLVSWLPLYHDMGLIGMLTVPMISGTDLVLAPPQDFMAGPTRWLEWISTFGGTGTAGPNFAYSLAARALRRASNLDLSRWRLALNGAEPVDPVSVEAFCTAGAPFGLASTAAFPAFGMAELAIAGTFPEPGTGMQVDTVDRHVLETERYAAPCHAGDRASSLAMLGRPIPGLEIRICDPESGSPMNAREVGELEIRGTSVTPGYYKRPEETAATFHDGWLRTGDLAYTVDGQLVVCGRIKDVIIVGGRNVFPEDVERAAAEVEGVRPGNVIAFGIAGHNGRERIIVVAETKADNPAPVRTEVHRRVSDAVGLPPGEVILVLPGSLPKTSSGKLQRSLCRTRYLGDALSPA